MGYYSCLPCWEPDDKSNREFRMLQSLATEICSHVLDYMTGDEIVQLVQLAPESGIGKHCVTLEHVGKFLPQERVINYIRRSGVDLHVPSNQRLLRIAAAVNHRGGNQLCDLCHTNNESVYFCWYWGLMKCRECAAYHEQHDEWEIERFPGIHHPWVSASSGRDLKKGPRKYFVRWAGRELLTKFEPVLRTRRLATHGGSVGNFTTICVLAAPAFDPYTGEPCGPLMTHQDIDEQLDDELSPHSIQSLVASLDLNRNESRLNELIRFGEDEEQKRRYAESRHIVSLLNMGID